MSALCWIRGHRDIRVAEAGVVARPGGMLPMLDGLMSYRPDENGDHLACTRCRRVVKAQDGDS